MEKETAEAVAKAVTENQEVVGGAFAAVGVAFGWLVKRLYGSIGHRITAASQAGASAAAAAAEVEKRRREDVISIYRTIDEHRRSDAEMHERMMQSTNEQTRVLGAIHADLQKALGERPTRDEVNHLIELHQATRA